MPDYEFNDRESLLTAHSSALEISGILGGNFFHFSTFVESYNIGKKSTLSPFNSRLQSDFTKANWNQVFQPIVNGNSERVELAGCFFFHFVALFTENKMKRKSVRC